MLVEKLKIINSKSEGKDVRASIPSKQNASIKEKRNV